MLTQNTLINARTGQAIDLAMQKLEVSGRIYPMGSFVRVTHRFRCLGTQPMEAIYVSALPTGGVIRRFKVIGENFEVDSKLEPRKKARKEYEAGVSEGHLSVLAETNQDGLVHLSVGQVQPDEEVSVIMDVVVGVTTKDKGFSFRFPFTLAPNYHSQAKVSATAGGGKIELPEDVFGDLTLPEWKNSSFGLHEVSFNLLVFSGLNFTTISSPSHRISVAPQTGGSFQVSLAGMGDTPNRDLVIDVAVPAVPAWLFADATLLGETATGKEPTVPVGAGKWTALIPSSAFQKGTRQPRKVCFVLDRSGSMSGQPIQSAKKALLACLSALNPDDEFGIVHFGNDARSFHPSLAKADDANRKKATVWVEAIECAGGTEMLGALAAATRVLGGPGGDVFMLTDGEVFQTGPIVEHMAASQSRVHVLGIGTASQHRFMAQLARRTGGVSDMVSPRDDVGMAGLKLFNQIQEPVLTDVSVALNGIHLPNFGTVWEGLPLLVTDPKGDGSLPGVILVSGQGVSDFPVQGFVQVAVPDGLTALLWAGRKIEDLSSKMDMVAAGTPKADIIEKEMTDLSVGYGLASRVMSLVAVIERIGDQAGVQPQQKVVALGIPEGMDNPFAEQRTSGSLFLNAVSRGGMLRSRAVAPTPPGVYGNVDDGARTMSFDAAPADYLDAPEYERGATVMSFMCLDSARDASPPMTKSAASPRSFVEMHDSHDGHGATMDFYPASVAAAGARPSTDPDEWTFTGNLLTDLAKLKADGGLPGHTSEERVQNTLVLALIVAHAAQQTNGVYDRHLDRMYAFLLAFKDSMGDKIATHKALQAIQNRACPMDLVPLVSLFQASSRDMLQALRSSL